MHTLFQKIRNGDQLINLAVFVLCIFGTVMVGSAIVGNADVATATGGAGGTVGAISIIKQVVFVLFGLFMMFLSTILYNHRLVNMKISVLLYFVMILMLLACLAFPEVNGAHGWWKIPVIGTFQPSELSKVILIVILSYIFTVPPSKGYVDKNWYMSHFKNYEPIYKRAKFKYYLKYYIVPILLFMSEVVVVVVIQNDTGTGLITLLICAACYFMTDEKYWGDFHKFVFKCLKWGLILVFGLGILYLILALTGAIGLIEKYAHINISFLQVYQMRRFSSWLDPLGDVYNTSAQLINALIAITKGGVTGVGLFNSTQKFGYIPEVHTDFITSLIFEELGLIGLAAIMIPYGIIIFRLLIHGFRTKNTRSRIILVGIASYFFLHLFVNLGGVSGLIPMTGIPLLFISQGGTSIMSGSIAIGIAQAIISVEKMGLKKG